MKQIPEPTKRRLVQLSSLLSQQQEERITSKTIQSLTGWSDSLIRRDILTLGYKGGVSNGYKVKELYDAICAEFGIAKTTNCKKNCCIVGLGRLGAALLENSLFENSAFTVVAGFDSNVNRTEILRSTFPLYPASKMETVIAEKKIEFAILSVPEKDAQKMADRLALCGIKGIVNYTNQVLTLPKSVAVENVSPVTALTNVAAEAANI